MCVIRGEPWLVFWAILTSPHRAPGWHRCLAARCEASQAEGSPPTSSGVHPSMDTGRRSALPCSLPALRAFLMLTLPSPPAGCPASEGCSWHAPDLHPLLSGGLLGPWWDTAMGGHVSVWLFLIPLKGSKLHFGHPCHPLEADLGLAWRLFHLVLLIKTDTEIKVVSAMMCRRRRVLLQCANMLVSFFFTLFFNLLSSISCC